MKVTKLTAHIEGIEVFEWILLEPVLTEANWLQSGCESHRGLHNQSTLSALTFLSILHRIVRECWQVKNSIAEQTRRW